MFAHILLDEVVVIDIDVFLIKDIGIGLVHCFRDDRVAQCGVLGRREVDRRGVTVFCLVWECYVIGRDTGLHTLFDCFSETVVPVIEPTATTTPPTVTPTISRLS